MNPTFATSRPAIGIGLVLAFVLVLLLGGSIWPASFFRSYWFGLMFWAQLSIGCLIVLLLQDLTGGAWGRAGASFMKAGASGFFVLLLLFVPTLFALPHIFSWTHIQQGISPQVLVNKQVWLNPTGFILRSLVYLGLFTVLIALRRRTIPLLPSGPCLVLTLILISFCSADWMMSLQPTFYSSLYPFLYFSGAMVSTFALLTGVISWLEIKGFAPVRTELLLDYGKLLFSAVFFWGYIVFCQFIIIWMGNLPDEAEWYVIRAEPGWLEVTVLVLTGHFVVPFCILLSQQVKKNPRQLLAICAVLFGMHFFEVFWLMRPTPGEGFTVSPFDLLMPLLIGAVWLWFVLGRPEINEGISILNKESHAA